MQRLKIVRDDNAESPRETYTNLGLMVCWKRGYRFGDEQPKSDPSDWLTEYTAENPQAVILPLYVYEHGGVRMRCGAFADPWDSGPVGYIVAGSEAFKDVGLDASTEADRAKMAEILTSEVETYDAYLTGDVWGFVVEEIRTCDLGHEHAEVVDSCWGFINLKDDAKEAIGEHLPEELRGEVLDKAWDNRGEPGL